MIGQLLPMEEWFCVAPKTYRYRAPGGGKWSARAKGLPGATAETVGRFGKGELIETSRGVSSFLQAARSPKGSLFTRHTLARRSHADWPWYGDRWLCEDGATRAVTVEELEGERHGT